VGRQEWLYGGQIVTGLSFTPAFLPGPLALRAGRRLTQSSV